MQHSPPTRAKRFALPLLAGLLVAWVLVQAAEFALYHVAIGMVVAIFVAVSLILAVALRAIIFGSRPARMWLTILAALQIVTVATRLTHIAYPSYIFAAGALGILIKCAVITVINLPPISQMQAAAEQRSA